VAYNRNGEAALRGARVIRDQNRSKAPFKVRQPAKVSSALIRDMRKEHNGQPWDSIRHHGRMACKVMFAFRHHLQMKAVQSRPNLLG